MGWFCVRTHMGVPKAQLLNYILSGGCRAQKRKPANGLSQKLHVLQKKGGGNLTNGKEKKKKERSQANHSLKHSWKDGDF